MRKYIHAKTLVPMTLLILSIIPFLIDPFDVILQGFIHILLSPSLLISDYLRIGGLGASLLNVALLMVMHTLLLIKLKLRLSGPIVAGLLTIVGFAFFGKNVMNIIPIYLGIYLNSKFQKLNLNHSSSFYYFLQVYHLL